MNTRIEQANKRVQLDLYARFGIVFGLITMFLGFVFLLIGTQDRFFAVASPILLTISVVCFIINIICGIMADPKHYQYKPLNEINFYLIKNLDGIYETNEEAQPMYNEDLVTMLIYKIISIDEFLNLQIHQLEENGNIQEINETYEVLDEEASDEIQQIYLDALIKCNGNIKRNGKYIDKFKNLNHKLRNRLIDYLIEIKYVLLHRRNGYYKKWITTKAEDNMTAIVQNMNFLEKRGKLYKTPPFDKMIKCRKETNR